MKRFQYFLFGLEKNDVSKNEQKDRIGGFNREDRFQQFITFAGARVHDQKTMAQAAVVGKSLVDDYYPSIRATLMENMARFNEQVASNTYNQENRISQGRTSVREKDNQRQQEQEPHHFAFDEIPDVLDSEMEYKPHPNVEEVELLDTKSHTSIYPSRPSWVYELLTYVVRKLWNSISQAVLHTTAVVETAVLGVASAVAFVFCELRVLEQPALNNVFLSQAKSFLQSISRMLAVQQASV